MCDVTHSYVTWRIHMWFALFLCDMTRFYVTWLIQIWHAAFICDITHIHVKRLVVCMWHDLSTTYQPFARGALCVAVRCSALQCVAVCCSVLQRVAVCCSVLQCVAVCCSVLQSSRRGFRLWTSGSWCTHIWFMTHSKVVRGSFMYDSWLFICDSWLIQIWFMTHSYLTHDSFINGSWLFIYGSWLIRIWFVTHPHVCCGAIQFPLRPYTLVSSVTRSRSEEHTSELQSR